MVSILQLDEKYNRVRRNFCFHLDIQDHGLARSLSRRIQDIGLQQEVFLTSRVSHVVRERAGGGSGEALPARCARREGRRADAMLERVRASHHPPHDHHKYVTLSVQKAINLLDKLYDTFFTASRKSHVRFFTKQFIKIEFLDKSCRPVYKEFSDWPAISLDVEPPREKRERKESTEKLTTTRSVTAGQRMTRKSRPRTKEKEKEPRGGYCEMCNSEYLEAGAHRRSARHLAFVRDAGNYLALDSLIGAGARVAAFLEQAAPLNGERRSLRSVCNGGSQSPEPGRARSPRRNGALDDERKRGARCKRPEEDKQYYKVVGVSTKLRSSGGFTKRKESPPRANGAKPLVVKFRKVRRSELSVLSDEAEQFMFPRRASSASSSSSSSSDDERALRPKRKSPAERRRPARPGALKEDSSEEEGWPDEAQRGARAPAAGPRARRPAPAAPPAPAPPEPAAPPAPPAPAEPASASCMRWEDGRLQYPPAVERLQFAFESVPRSEPWYETFRRQDRDQLLTRNVPRYFALYSTAAPKLPYEIGQLPPLKPDCCPLSELMKQRDEFAGPSRSYGTRGTNRHRARRPALEGRARKSPREHASTLAILGSAGLLARRRLADDKSEASEDTASDALAESGPAGGCGDRAASERLRQFMAEVFSERGELDACATAAPAPGAEPALPPASRAPDVPSLLSGSDACDLVRNELRAAAAPRARRARFKKNKTGWPNKKKQKKGSRTDSSEFEHKGESLDGSSAGPADDEATRDASSEPEPDSGASPGRAAAEKCKSEDESRDGDGHTLTDTVSETIDADSSDKLLIDLKVAVDGETELSEKKEERNAGTSGSEDERELRKKRRALAGLCEWLPVVRVARVQPPAARRLRSAARARPRARPRRR